MSDRVFEVGTEVGAGRFIVERILGEGGMGVVCQAQDQMLNKTVALKFLTPEIQANQEALEAMRNETRKSLELTHPNIIRIHDFHHFAHELPFISMEYIEGITLSYLKSQQPQRLFPWDRIEPHVPQLCAALSYAHGVGIIHRDLKPANMMLDQNQRLKLADFGLSVTAGDNEESAEMGTSGTPCYMSPQQIVGVPSRPTDDIYALGATFYEFLTSQPPFYKGNVLFQVRETVPASMGERLLEFGLENKIPSHVEELVLDCLQKDPDRRPQSIEEVADRLGATSFSTSFVKQTNLVTAEEPKVKAGYKGKSAVGPVAAFCFVIVGAALILNEMKQLDEPEDPVLKPVKQSAAAVAEDTQVNELILGTIAPTASEIRLFLHQGKQGAGSAAGYSKYAWKANSQRWRLEHNTLLGGVTQPTSPDVVSISQLVLPLGQETDFIFGFAWKQGTGTGHPRVFYRCVATTPENKNAADISIDGISFTPGNRNRIDMQGIMAPYRITTTATGTLRKFAEYDWRGMGETAVADMIVKLTKSETVKDGGEWLIVQCDGNLIRHVINGEEVSEFDLAAEAENSREATRRKLIEKHAKQTATIALELRAENGGGGIQMAFSEFFFAPLNEKR